MSHDLLHTPVCELLGIEHRVVQAGMGYVARAEEVPVFASGLGNPGPWVRQLHECGAVVMRWRRVR